MKDGDTEEDVRNLFSNEGIVEKVEMVTDKQTGKLKPFCFITFEDTDVTDKCVCKSAVDVVVNFLASHWSQQEVVLIFCYDILFVHHFLSLQ